MLDRGNGLTESRGELAETDQPKEGERDLPGSARRCIWDAESQPAAGHESCSGRNNRGQEIQNPIRSRPEKGAECNEGRHAQKSQNRALRADKPQHSDPTILPITPPSACAVPVNSRPVRPCPLKDRGRAVNWRSAMGRTTVLPSRERDRARLSIVQDADLHATIDRVERGRCA